MKASITSFFLDQIDLLTGHLIGDLTAAPVDVRLPDLVTDGGT
jgi:hypothetical protein